MTRNESKTYDTVSRLFHWITALVAVHIAAAIHHGLVMGDGVMARIWPPIRRREPHA